MLDLPKRVALIAVEVAAGEATLHLEPLTDAQYLALNETAEIGDARVIFRASRQEGLFEDRLRRIDGVTIDGEPFTVGNPEHMARVPQPWKAMALARLLRYAGGLSESDLGNSKPPADPSPAEGTLSPD